MKHFTYPSSFITQLSVMLIASTFGLLSGCSSTDKETETLAKNVTQNYVGFAPDTQESDFDPAQSRNSGAWGAVYMTEAELNDKDRSIVDYSAIPAYENDPELTKWKDKFGEENAFATTNGEKLYYDSCAGCHMHNGKGAKGAGYYPPLANNPKMESKYYILDILINGFRGMPSFRSLMNDKQMAAVTEYVMTDLNGYDAQVSDADAAQLRPAIPPQGEAVH